MQFLLAGVAFFSTLFGGGVAVRVQDKLHLVLGAAAGVMLGVVTFDLIPEALDSTDRELFGVPVAMLTVALGFFTIHVLERAIAIHRAHEEEFDAHGHHPHGHERIGMLAGGGLVVHSVLDGVGIGLAFQAGRAVGIAVAIAVIAHDFADGFNTFTITTLYGNERRRALTLLLLDAVAPMVGVTIGTLVHVPSGAVGLYLGYFAGFLLYLATADILPEAHARHASRLTLAFTAGGAALMWLVVGLAG